jgi:hypothetical protein
MKLDGFLIARRQFYGVLREGPGIFRNLRASLAWRLLPRNARFGLARPNLYIVADDDIITVVFVFECLTNSAASGRDAGAQLFESEPLNEFFMSVASSAGR